MLWYKTIENAFHLGLLYMSTTKLSLKSAVLININIMIGAGIFINTVELAKRSGFLSCFTYAFVGLLMLPLIICVASMVRLYPSGGFYAYAANEIHPFAGFISAWSYFIGKLGSAMLLVHTALLLCQQIIPVLAATNIFLMDICVVALFMLLNMFNMQTGRTIQGWLTVIKIVPIAFVVLAGLYCMNPSNLIVPTTWSTGFWSSIPLVIYAFLGFEATASLSSRIENAQKNGPLAIFISYASVIGLYVLYQFLFCAATGEQLMLQQSYLGAFPTLLRALLGSSIGSFAFLHGLLNLFIAASALGGSYGILYSNSWNLYALAEKKHIIASRIFAQLNAQNIPFAAVMAEGAIMLFYLYMSAGKQLPLQLTSVIGSIIAYTLSVIALFCARYTVKVTMPFWLIILAACNCLLLLFTCVRSFSLAALVPMFGFLSLLVGGSCAYFLVKNNKSSQN